MKVLEIRHLNKQDLNTMKGMLMNRGLNYAAGGLSHLRNLPHMSNLYLVKIGDQEYHNWNIVYVETKNIKRAERMINSNRFVYIVNQIPLTEEIDSYI
jgi:hypothetical protein